MSLTVRLGLESGHADICAKLVVPPEVEPSVKSVGLAAPQTSVRAVEPFPTVSQSFPLSHNPLSTPPGTTVTGGQLEISATRAMYSWWAANVARRQKVELRRISAAISGSTGRTLAPCCIP